MQAFAMLAEANTVIALHVATNASAGAIGLPAAGTHTEKDAILRHITLQVLSARTHMRLYAVLLSKTYHSMLHEHFDMSKTLTLHYVCSSTTVLS